MTKKELIKALEPFDDEMEVFLAERATEFTYGLLNSARKQKINFMEEPGGKVESSYEVIILDEY